MYVLTQTPRLFFQVSDGFGFPWIYKQYQYNDISYLLHICYIKCITQIYITQNSKYYNKNHV